MLERIESTPGILTHSLPALGLPETPAVAFVPARIARLARTKRPNRQPRFGLYIKGRAVYPQVLKKQNIPPLGQQLDGLAQVQARHFFV